MKLSAPKRKFVKTVNEYPEQIVAAPRRSSDVNATFPCGAIIAGNNVIRFEIPQQKEVAKVDAIDTAEHNEEAVQDPIRRDLNLLSMGKQLLDCCKKGNAAEVRKLMKDGAPFIADWVGTSPLHYSVMNKHVEVTELLLKHGISKDTRNKVGRTPLHVAANMGLAYMVKLLLTYGADVNCKDMLHMTPLHWAAESGDLLTARILVDYGSDTRVINKFGKTACAIARSSKHMDVVRLILDTELLPLTTRALKVSDMRVKVVNCARDMWPVAEILEPSSSEMKATTTQETKKNKKVVVIATDSDLDGPMGTIRFGSVIDPPSESSASDEMSADSAIKLLQSHGVSVMEPDKDTVVSSAVLRGHTIRLTDAGMLAFKSLEKNLRLDKLPLPTAQECDDETGATPTKKTKVTDGSSPRKDSSSGEDDNSGDVIIGSALSSCTIDLPSSKSTSNKLEDIAAGLKAITNPQDRTKVYLQRLKDKQKEILRHLEIIENQRTIKQHELTQINQQIRSLESVSSNIKK